MLTLTIHINTILENAIQAKLAIRRYVCFHSQLYKCGEMIENPQRQAIKGDRVEVSVDKRSKESAKGFPYRGCLHPP